MSCRAVGSCVTLLLAFAQPAASQAPRFGVDQRVELMAILFKFAGNREFNQNNFQPYIADIERHFGAFRNHEAVTIARGLRGQYGLGFANVMAVAIRVSDPPALRERVPFDSVSGWTVPPDAARRFIEAARRFHKKISGSEDPFGRAEWAAPFTRGPYIALGPAKAYIIMTEGGLVVDDRLRVRSEQGQPIPGLFAAGCNGMGGLVLLGHGLHIAWAVTSGRLAGRHAAGAG